MKQTLTRETAAAFRVRFGLLRCATCRQERPLRACVQATVEVRYERSTPPRAVVLCDEVQRPTFAMSLFSVRRSRSGCERSGSRLILDAGSTFLCVFVLAALKQRPRLARAWNFAVSGYCCVAVAVAARSEARWGLAVTCSSRAVQRDVRLVLPDVADEVDDLGVDGDGVEVAVAA